jgi:hypothetical protein
VSWLRKGDTAHQHRAVSAILEHPDYDDRLLNEVYGFFEACAECAAARGAEYVVTRGEALRAGGSITRGAQLIEIALFAQLFTETITLPNGRLEYKLINEPEFMHIRTAAEKEWERLRQADSSNTSLTVPVRLRDGDACRYCGKVVIWGDTRSARGATYDNRERHRTGPGTVDIVVVSCRGCNAGRRDDPDADQRYPLRPPPAQPYYHPKTVAWLAEHGHQVPSGSPPADAPAPRPGTRPDTAPTPRPRTQRDTARPVTGTPARPATDTAPARPAPPAATAPPAPPEQPGPPTAKAGSAGSGRAGSGAAPSTGRQRDHPQRRRRGRRGRRGGTPPPGG